MEDRNMAPPACDSCDGSGHLDTGRMVPWTGEWIHDTCTHCDGTRVEPFWTCIACGEMFDWGCPNPCDQSEGNLDPICCACAQDREFETITAGLRTILKAKHMAAGEEA